MSPWPFPHVVAHRGGGARAPENTLAAIRAGHELGFGAVEFDVTLSADGEALLMHDATLERTTDGAGAVARHTWAQLAHLDAGGWFASDFAGEPIPRLRQVADYCREKGIWMNVEIKPARGAESRTGERVAAELERFGPGAAGQRGAQLSARVPLLSSFSMDALAAARSAAPSLPRGLLCTRVPADWQQRLAGLECVALHCDHRHLDAATVAALHGAGYWVFCYTVNDRPRAVELARWGVDAICTDQLEQVDASVFAIE